MSPEQFVVKTLEVNWFQIVSASLNLAILGIVANLVRKFSRLELKVDLMWKVFSKRFGLENDENGG